MLWLPLELEHLVVIVACHRFQRKRIFTWQLPITSNIFTQKVTHRHKKLPSTRFFNEYSILLDFGPPFCYFVIAFGS